MIAGTLAFLAGILLFQQMAELPSVGWTGLLPFLLLLAWRSPRFRLPFLVLSGFLWALCHGHWILSDLLIPQLEGRDLWVEGVIASLPERQEHRTRFRLQVERLEHEGRPYPSPGVIRLNWYRDAPPLNAGERWRLRVRLRQPRGFMNPGGFDYEGWLFREGIRATGYVRTDGENRRLERGDAGSLLLRWRQAVRDRLYDTVENRETAGLLAALVLGDRSGVDRQRWEVLSATGTNHLMAISGLHIGIVAGLLFFLVRGVWVRSATLSLRFPAPQAAAVGALTAAFLYAALAGFTVPTRRALIMLAVLLGGVLLRRTQRSTQGLALALLLVVVAEPVAVLSAGFWLSFAAVGTIFYGMSGRLSRNGLWWKWGRVQWLVALGLVPLLLAWQLKVSLLAPLVNLVAVPLFSLVVVPLALAGSLLALLSEAVGSLILSPLQWLLPLWFELLSAVAGLPWAGWEGSGIPAWGLLAAVVGVCLLLAPKGLPGRWLGLLFLLPLGLLRSPLPGTGEVWVTLLDVGQGMSAVIRTAGHTLVYDAGPRYSADFNAGSAVVVPFLRMAGVSRIDRLILSNGDSDHVGGARALADEFPIADVMSGEPGRLPWANALPCEDTAAWRWDGVDFRILSPHGGHAWEGNNASCVLRIESGGRVILLSGDIERAVESRLVKEKKPWLKADLVQIPHHGSLSSSTPEFVQAVSPRYALAAAGYGNRYGFPKPRVVARWRAAGAEVLETAEAGAIEFRVGAGGKLSPPQRYRLERRRYWTSFAAE